MHNSILGYKHIRHYILAGQRLRGALQRGMSTIPPAHQQHNTTQRNNHKPRESPQAGAGPSQGDLVAELIKGLEDKQYPKYPIVDIGANLCSNKFDKYRDEVIDRAVRAGLDSIIITGSCLRSTAAAAQLGNSPPKALPLYFTAGCHPHNAKHYTDEIHAELIKLAKDPKCKAVGECGLDFNRNFSPPAVQETVFIRQIEMAEDLGMPLFMHSRDASDRFFEILREHRKTVPGVLHCFTGNEQDLKTALSLDLYIGITGWVCDERPERGGEALAALLPLIPKDRLLIETDCPYITPRTLKSSLGKGKIWNNEPALLPFVLEKVAAARGESMEHVARISTENAHRLFKLDH